jgi:tetratricopeptide (TPR) repeat protein
VSTKDNEGDLVKQPGEGEAQAIEETVEAPLRAERVESPLTVGEMVQGAKEILDDVSISARRLIDRGRYRKVRISRRGKQVLPDIPVAAAAVVEAASLYGAGLGRVLAANMGVNFLFDVEIVNEADKFLEKGKKALLDGELDRASEAFERALRIDDLHPEAHLQLGVVRRLQGRLEEARACFARVRGLDETGEHGQRAEELLRGLESEA